MDVNAIKTLVKTSMNINFDFKVPTFQTLDKNKEYETRLYERSKYIFIKYHTIDDDYCNNNNKSSKSGFEMVMKNVLKLMKYTQGENARKIKMHFIMPVFVSVETLDNPTASNGNIIEIKVMMCLPPEYQQHESPLPIDPEIETASIDQFKCFVKTFSGFAADEDYKNQAKKLIDIIKNEKGDTVNLNGKKIICISYDAPYILVGRRNEVQLIYK